MLNFDDNVGRSTPVGIYPAGAAPGGHLDMSGNVWEWCEDDWHSNEKSGPDDSSAWVDEPRGSGRVIRGGSWGNDARRCRSAYRIYGVLDYRSDYLGFRLSRSVTLGP